MLLDLITAAILDQRNPPSYNEAREMAIRVERMLASEIIHTITEWLAAVMPNTNI